MGFEPMTPRIHVRNKTNETIKKLVFKFRDGSMDSKIRKLKPISKEQAAIPLWGVKAVDGAYVDLVMKHELNDRTFEDVILDRYDKRMNVLVEIEKINGDGSFEYSATPMGIEDKG